MFMCYGDTSVVSSGGKSVESVENEMYLGEKRTQRREKRQKDNITVCRDTVTIHVFV